LKLLKAFDVGDVVFRIPKDHIESPLSPSKKNLSWIENGFEPDSSWLEDGIRNVENVFELLNSVPMPQNIKELAFPGCKLVQCLSSLLHMHHGKYIRNNKGKMEPLEVIVLRDSLKLKNSVSAQVMITHE